MARKLVYIRVDRLDALKLGKGILTDKELAGRVGVYPSYIHKVKAQGRCRQATAERLAKVLGWGFVERSPAAKGGTFAIVEPYDLPTLEECHTAHELERGRGPDDAEALPGPGPSIVEPPTTNLVQTVFEFISRPVPEKWNYYNKRDRLIFWRGLAAEPTAAARMHLFPRDRVCAAEVWLEALGHPLESMTRKDTKQINAIIAAAPGWEKSEKGLRFGPYGFCRGFVRAQHSERNGGKILLAAKKCNKTAQGLNF